jgi:hypothetical protein
MKGFGLNTLTHQCNRKGLFSNHNQESVYYLKEADADEFVQVTDMDVK